MFLHVVNMEYYGFLTNMDSSITDNLYNDLWEVNNNFELWKKHYLHPNFSLTLNDAFSVEMVRIFFIIYR